MRSFYFELREELKGDEHSIPSNINVKKNTTPSTPPLLKKEMINNESINNNMNNTTNIMNNTNNISNNNNTNMINNNTNNTNNNTPEIKLTDLGKVKKHSEDLMAFILNKNG
jgi:hypothetical protein